MDPDNVALRLTARTALLTIVVAVWVSVAAVVMLFFGMLVTGVAVLSGAYLAEGNPYFGIGLVLGFLIGGALASMIAIWVQDLLRARLV